MTQYDRIYKCISLFIGIILAILICIDMPLALTLVSLVGVIFIYVFFNEKIIYILVILLSAVPVGWGAELVFHTRVNLMIIQLYVQDIALLLFCAKTISINIKQNLIEKTLRYSWGERIQDWLMILFFGETIIYFLTSISIIPVSEVLKEFKYMSLFCITFLLIRKNAISFFKNINIQNIETMLSIGMTFYSIIVYFVYFWRDSFFAPVYSGSMWESLNRVSFINDALFIFSIPIVVNRFLRNRKKSYLYLIALILQIIAIGISQTRSVVLLSLVSTLCSIIIFHIRSDQRIFLRRVIPLFIVILIIPFLLGSTQFFQNSVNRLSLLSNYTDDSSWLSRTTTNAVIGTYIASRPLGYGIGSTLPIYINNDKEGDSVSYTDNLYLSIGYKMGLPGLVAFTLLMIITCVNTLMKGFKDRLSSMQLAFPLFIIYVTYLGSQLLRASSLIFIFCIIASIPHGSLINNERST